MEARILDLSGKYYGTKIELLENNKKIGGFSIWLTSGEPSERYLRAYGYTKEQWDANELVDNGWGGQSPIRETDITCDSHYECGKTFGLAEFIVRMINETS